MFNSFEIANLFAVKFYQFLYSLPSVLFAICRPGSASFDEREVSKKITIRTIIYTVLTI